MNPELVHTLTTRTYRTRRAPLVADRYGGSIEPYKVVVEIRKEKRRAVVYGRSTKFARGGKVNFNLEGYQYPGPPEWLRLLLKRQGETY